MDLERYSTIATCLEDDAAHLREENPADEMADNMDAAAALMAAMWSELQELRAQLDQAGRIMTEVHAAAEPDDGPDQNAIIPARLFGEFVDAHAAWLHRRHATTESVTDDTRDDLSSWFGLSYSSFATLPRVLMEAMPKEWQKKMARLLFEADDAFPNVPDIGYRVQITQNGKMIKTPAWLLNYRRPDLEMIAHMRKVP